MLLAEDAAISLYAVSDLWTRRGLVVGLRGGLGNSVVFLKECRPRLIVLRELDPVHRLDEGRETLESEGLLVKGAVDVQHPIL